MKVLTVQALMMGVRERRVENYLDDEVTKLGGITRKWISPGRDGVPDRIVINPVTAEMMIANLRKLKPGTLVADFHLVEVKTIDGVLEFHQGREHDRLIEAGAQVDTVYGAAGVDAWIREVLLK